MRNGTFSSIIVNGTMSKLVCAAVLLCATSAWAQGWQSPYDRGYDAGYYDRYVPADRQSVVTDFGRGYQTGRDDSFEDDAIAAGAMRSPFAAPRYDHDDARSDCRVGSGSFGSPFYDPACR
jgi:hypothetical protein